MFAQSVQSILTHLSGELKQQAIQQFRANPILRDPNARSELEQLGILDLSAAQESSQQSEGKNSVQKQPEGVNVTQKEGEVKVAQISQVMRLSVSGRVVGPFPLCVHLRFLGPESPLVCRTSAGSVNWSSGPFKHSYYARSKVGGGSGANNIPGLTAREQNILLLVNQEEQYEQFFKDKKAAAANEKTNKGIIGNLMKSAALKGMAILFSAM